MKITLISTSPALYQYVNACAGKFGGVNLVDPMRQDYSSLETGHNLVLVHAQAYPEGMKELLAGLAVNQKNIIGIASDQPKLREMLSFVKLGVRAYFNSYMVDIHYQQMVRLLDIGLNWYPPQLLSEVLEIAGRKTGDGQAEKQLGRLTPRERDIANAVSRGMSNRRIADALHISERTVKTHLTHIFGKLEVNDRVALVIKLTKPSDDIANQA